MGTLIDVNVSDGVRDTDRHKDGYIVPTMVQLRTEHSILAAEFVLFGWINGDPSLIAVSNLIC